MHLSSIATSLSPAYVYAVCFSGPDSPTGVSTVVTGSNTVEVSWTPSSSGMCDVFSTSYSIRYRLSGSTGNYTTVNISGTTSVTLQDLAPNAEYDVEVAAINSNGAISHYSVVAQFTVTPPVEPETSKILYFPIYIVISFACACLHVSIWLHAVPVYPLQWPVPAPVLVHVWVLLGEASLEVSC